MKTTLFCTVLILFLTPQLVAQEAIQTTLIGEVIDRPNSHRLILLRSHEDFRTAKNQVLIPIHNGIFEYVLHSDHEEQYRLIFEEEYYAGSMVILNFFSEQGVVNFTVYSYEEREKNHIEGSGQLTTEYHAYHRNRKNVVNAFQEPLSLKEEQMKKEEIYYIPEAFEILQKLEAIEDTAYEEKKPLWDELKKLGGFYNWLTPEAQAIQEEYKRGNQMWNDMDLQYAKEHTSIVGYSTLMNQIATGHFFGVVDTAYIAELFNTVYAPKYPDHPYTERMRLLMGNVVSAGIGGRYIDFEAPNLEGDMVKLSEQIQGKIAVIHLWASWCGPCLSKGRALAPVYEAYKDKGFTVVGVARERNNTNAMKAAIERHQYSWLNLVELHDNANIWVKYGLGNSGGADFLVDEQGIVLAINPSAEEVEAILKERLK